MIQVKRLSIGIFPRYLLWFVMAPDGHIISQWIMIRPSSVYMDETARDGKVFYIDSFWRAWWVSDKS